MQSVVCISPLFVLFLSIASLVIILYQFNIHNKSCKECNQCQVCPEVSPETPLEKIIIENPIVSQPVIPQIDPVRIYDYDKLQDPLTRPSRRVSRYELPPHQFKRMIDIHTSGYPDSFSMFGTLVQVGDKDPNNKVLKLFGRRRDHHTNGRYEYYTEISVGNTTIKVPIHTKRKHRELYTDDVVNINELGSKYRVSLYKIDEPSYYPDIL